MFAVLKACEPGVAVTIETKPRDGEDERQKRQHSCHRHKQKHFIRRASCHCLAGVSKADQVYQQNRPL